MSLHTPPATDPVGGPGYERRDVNLRAILYLAIAIFVLVVGTMIGLRYLMRAFDAQAERSDPVLSPLAADQTPPTPRLQNTPTRDFVDYRAEQDEQLNSYGWVDKAQGKVRIPVSVAMEKALKEGLPKPKPQQADPEENNTEAPAEEK